MASFDEITITELFGRFSIKAPGCNSIWFDEDDDRLHIPAITAGTPEEARLFAAAINKAADELEKVFLAGQ